MKETTVTINYDDEKLSALKLYMSQKSLILDDELTDSIENLYKKHVPQSVRDFIDLRNGSIAERPTPKPRKPKQTDVTKVENPDV